MIASHTLPSPTDFHMGGSVVQETAGPQGVPVLQSWSGELGVRVWSVGRVIEGDQVCQAGCAARTEQTFGDGGR